MFTTTVFSVIVLRRALRGDSSWCGTWAAVASALVLLGPWCGHAQRVTPCFSRANPPPSCDHGLQGLELYNHFLENGKVWLTTCTQLSADYFGLPYNEIPFPIAFNLTGFDPEAAWPRAVADIPANSEFCAKARSSWSFCEFCGFVYAEPCGFGRDPPRCEEYDATSAAEPEFWSDQERILARETSCSFLEGNMLIYFENVGREEEGALADVRNVSLHADALELFLGFPGQCDVLRQSYPHCYWCKNNKEDPVSMCSYDEMCNEQPSEESRLDEMSDADVAQTCEAIGNMVNGDLESVRVYDLDRVYTWDLCERAQQAVPRGCPGVCHACFNTTHPPTCHRNQDGDMEETTEVVFAAANLWSMLGKPANDRNNHMSELALLRSTHPSCPVFRDVYKYGYWCDDRYAQDETNDLFDCGRFRYEYCAGPLSPFSLQPYNGTDQADFSKACHTFQNYYAQGVFVLPTLELCQDQQLYRQGCPCVSEEDRQIDKDYLGADTTTKKWTLVWMSRSAAILSCLGACCILYNVWVKTVGNVHVYHQLLVGMAIFDIVTAVAWGFATYPIDDEEGYSIAGAHGSETSCRVQGFFIQFGFTSIFYNSSLAAYYWLTITKNWKEKKLCKISPMLHGLPLLIGLALACVGLPYYEGFDYACHLLPYPQGDLWKVLLFVVCPVGISILIIFWAMVSCYYAIKSIPFEDSRLKEMVFWQATFYCLSFCVTWPIVMCVYITGWDFEKKKFAFSAVVAFVAPLQGFNNCLVFLFPKLYASMQRARQSRSVVSSSGMSSEHGHRSGFHRSMEDSEIPHSSKEGVDSVYPSTVSTGVSSSAGNAILLDPSIAIAREETNLAGDKIRGETANEPVECRVCIKGPDQEAGEQLDSVKE